MYEVTRIDNTKGGMHQLVPEGDFNTALLVSDRA